MKASQLMNRYPLVEEVFTPLTAPKLFDLIKDNPIYDSDSEAEYVETLDKAKALVRALQLAPEVIVAAKY